jgi:hypothetical protein
MDPLGGDCKDWTNQTACEAGTRGCRWKDNKCEEDFTGAKGALKLNLLCHACTGAYIRRLVILFELMDHYQIPEDVNATVPRATVAKSLKAILFFSSGVCSTDKDDKFCLPQLQSQTVDFAANPCQALATLKANTGCCAPTFLVFLMNVCKMIAVEDPANQCVADSAAVQGVVATCALSGNPKIDVGESCAREIFKPYVKLVIAGLDDAWFAVAANRAIVLAIIAKIISFNSGVDQTNVKANVDGAATRRLLGTGQVVVTATLDVDSASQHMGVTSGLGASSNLETLTLNQEAQASGLGTITVTSQGVTNGPPAASSAAANAISFATTALVVAAYLTF